MSDWVQPYAPDYSPQGDETRVMLDKLNKNQQDIYVKLNRVRKLDAGSTAPSDPVQDHLWFDTNTHTLKRWNGIAWVRVSHVAVSNENELVSVVGNVGSTELSIVIGEPISLNQDLSIPENVSLVFLKGGKIAVGSKSAVTETIGTGDGTTTSFSYTVADPPIKRQSITISYTIGGTNYTATDSGTGIITGTNVSGTVNYMSGALSLIFTTAPDNATTIDITYTPTYLLTINGSMEAGLYPVFGGDGEVTGAPKVEVVHPEWFGAKGDGTTDDSIAVQKALDLAPHVVLVGKYAISATLRGKTGTVIRGISPKFSELIVNSGSYRSAILELNIDSSGSTWQDAYPNFQSGGVFCLYFRNPAGSTLPCIFAGGSYRFEDLTFDGFSQGIKVAGSYVDTVTIRRVHFKNCIFDANYAISATQLGDGYVFEQIHIVSVAASNLYKNGIHIGKAGAGRLSEILGGHIFVERCFPITLEKLHMEGTRIIIDSSECIIRDSYLRATSSPVIELRNTQGGWRSVMLENILIIVQRDYNLSSVAGEDIKVVAGYKIEFKNVKRKLTAMSAVAESHGYFGVYMTDGGASPFVGTWAHLYSEEGVVNTSTGEVQVAGGLPIGGGSSFSASAASSASVKWNASSGTYYYRYVLFFDVYRAVGKPDGGTEQVVAVTNGGDGVVHSISLGTSVKNRGILRIYRGTASGSYDAYVDIPLLTSNATLFDDGVAVSGFPWRSRTAAGIDNVNANCYSLMFSYDGRVIARGLNSPPAYGSWLRGDMILSVVPSEDANSMVSYGWVCLANGSPGTWKPMYVSTVSPAV